MTTPRSCPICGAGPDLAHEFLRERIHAERLTPFSYASRKTPEFMNLHLVRCGQCDLVYADTPPSAQKLAQAYHRAAYDSRDEAEDAAQAYHTAIAPLLSRLRGRHSALEIGTGTGAFLERLSQDGFRGLTGIEPSAAAIEAAPKHRQAWLVHDIFHADQFAPDSLDLVCCFMTMEHVHDPGKLIREVYALLKPGGILVTATHDWRAWPNRLLGRRSPIIDIEHMQLFSQRSIEYGFRTAGLHDVSSAVYRNTYAAAYWLRLLPLPAGLKAWAMGAPGLTALLRRRLQLNVGNRICWGFRPSSPQAPTS